MRWGGAGRGVGSEARVDWEEGGCGRRVGVYCLCLLSGFLTSPLCIYSNIGFNCASSRGRNFKRVINGIQGMQKNDPKGYEYVKCTLVRNTYSSR